MFKSKILNVLLAAIVAFGLWLYVITFVSSERDETFYDIPVSYQGEAIMNERNLMVTTENKPTVSLTLYGKRSELRKLSVENITILADLSKIGEAGNHSLNYSIFYPGNVPDDAFTVQSQYPSMVRLTVERRVTKEVPVELRFKGRVSRDYIVDKENLELDRENITISGPASVIDQITQAIVEVDLTDRTASFVESYRFILSDSEKQPVDAKMVETNAAEVRLTVYIKRVLEIPLLVTVTDGGGATEKTSEIKIDPEVIQVAGSEVQLEEIADGLELGTLDLGELVGDSTIRFPINLPEGLENLSGKTEAVVTVKFPELKTRNFTVFASNFEALNVPEGLEVVFINSEIQVSVRGPKALISKMKSEDIFITVDFANAEVGSYTVKANVVMGEGFTAAGVIGTYRVSATVQELVPEEDK